MPTDITKGISINDRIVQVAKKYVNRQEISGNLGWVDKLFEAKMKLVGWKKLEAWCAYFGELVWKEAFLNKAIEDAVKTEASNPTYRQLDLLFAPSALGTWANFKAAPQYPCSNVPRIGSLMIFQHGDTWQGHLAIVVGIAPDVKSVATIEGNTDGGGSREGDMVAQKNRMVDFNRSKSRLNLLGFIHPTK